MADDAQREHLADQELARAGSVMASPRLPEWRRNLPQSLGPTMGTGAQAALNLLDILAALGPSPQDMFGGKVASLANKAGLLELLTGGDQASSSQNAAIRPSTWGAMAPEAKAMMNQFGDRFPGAFERLLQSPADLTATVTKNMPKQAAGMLRKPTAAKHEMKVRPDYAKEPWTAGHEVQHSLNADRVAGTDPLDALTIGTLMRELLPSGHRGSLDALLKQSLMTDPRASLFQKVLGSGPKVVNPQTVDRNVMRGAMDEALAYTAENAARPNADPLLRTLADRLGVRW